MPKKNEKGNKARSRKLENEKLKREMKTLKEEDKVTKMKAQKLESDLKFLETELKNSRGLNIKFFDKHKALSILISNFYQRHCLENSRNSQTQDKLDFEDMFKKLELIFEEFKLQRFRLSRTSENPNMIETSNSYTIKSQNKSKSDQNPKPSRTTTSPEMKRCPHRTRIRIWGSQRRHTRSLPGRRSSRRTRLRIICRRITRNRTRIMERI